MFALPRDEFYAYELKKQESSYTEALPLNLLCGSYNLAGLSDSEFDDQCLQDWLHSTRTDVPRVDIYCVGVQEIVPLDARGWFSGDSSERLERWKQRLSRRLGEDEYQCIASETLFGLAIWLFVHVAHAPHVHHVSTQTVGAGLLGTGGNKGGVAIRLSLYNSSLCFVNSHLAAHQNEIDMRNSDFQAIFSKLRFNVNAASPTADSTGTQPAAQPQSASIAALEVAELEEKASSSIFRRYATLIDHDFVFWLGDLNYRIDLPISEVVEAIHGKKWKVLLDADQLNKQQSLGIAFSDFLEQPIQFAPTYKFKKGYEKGNVYDTDKGDKKPPSYCDRVLYLAAPGDALRAVAYDSVPSCCASDHKPVRAEFELMIRFAMIEQSERTVTALKTKFDAFQAKLVSVLPNSIHPVPESFEPTLHDASMVSFKSKMASAAASAARSAKSMAAGVSVLSGDSNYVSERIIRERKDEQTSSVGSGFASGFSELFTKPASGAQSGGAAGFFKGLAQGIGGLIAKPTAGMLDALSHSLQSAAVSAADDVDPELIAAAADTRYSLDGYLRLAWHYTIQKQPSHSAPSLPSVETTESFNETRVSRSASAFGRPTRSSSPLTTSIQPVAANSTGFERVLRNLSETLLVSIKICDLRTALLVSNMRLCVIGIPTEFAPPEPQVEAKAAAHAKKLARSRVVSLRSGSPGNEDKVEAGSLQLWLGPHRGTRELEFRADAADESLVVQCVTVDPSGADAYWSHRIVCASAREATDVAAVLNAFMQYSNQLLGSAV